MSVHQLDKVLFAVGDGVNDHALLILAQFGQLETLEFPPVQGVGIGAVRPQQRGPVLARLCIQQTLHGLQFVELAAARFPILQEHIQRCQLQ